MNPPADNEREPMFTGEFLFESDMDYVDSPFSGQQLSMTSHSFEAYSVAQLGRQLSSFGQSVGDFFSSPWRENTAEGWAEYTPRSARLVANSTWPGLIRKSIWLRLPADTPTETWIPEVITEVEKQADRIRLRRKIGLFVVFSQDAPD